MRVRLGFMMILFPIVLFAAELICPPADTISRVPGEYAWESKDGRWQGYFAGPRVGRGSSTHVTDFQQTRWIQLNDLPDSYGVIECDYSGNFSDEIIRFVSIDSTATKLPSGIHWSCDFNPQIPGTQCVCAGDPAECRYPL